MKKEEFTNLWQKLKDGGFLSFYAECLNPDKVYNKFYNSSDSKDKTPKVITNEDSGKSCVNCAMITKCRYAVLDKKCRHYTEVIA